MKKLFGFTLAMSVAFGASQVDARYLEADPLGLVDGPSVYGYAAQNPQRYTDPRGEQSISFNGSSLNTFDQNGRPVASYPAVSGKSSSCQCSEDMNIPDYGPTPEGPYTVNPADTNHWSFLKGLGGWGSRIGWGNQRTLLVPTGHNALGRTQMYIHGGSFPGSIGCIDLTNQNDAFHDWLSRQSGPVPVAVNYPDNDASPSSPAVP